MANGAGMVRVHDVGPTLQAAKVVGEDPEPAHVPDGGGALVGEA
jgi:hypothetical protein